MKTAFPVALLGLATLAPSVARADDKSACLDASYAGQRLRRTHKLVEAREELRACAAAACPAVVQADCAGWLADVERELPSVVVAAKDATGADLIDVRVDVDGVVFARVLDGRALPMDPGPHALRFERPDGTSANLQIVAREGEKNQLISVALGPPPGAPQVPAPPAEPGVSAAARPLGVRTVASLATAGAGLAVLGVGAYFGLTAIARNHDSAPYCGVGGAKDACYGAGVSLRDDAVRDATISTVLVSGGAVMIAAGAVLWLTDPAAHGPSMNVAFDGRVLRVRGAF
jgi:hypothetical protein